MGPPRRLWLIVPWVLLGAGSPGNGVRAVHTHVVTVAPDGSFDPATVEVHPGDTVVWRGLGRTDSIVRVPVPGRGQDVCTLRQPFDPFDVNEFTGPTRSGVPGIFVRGSTEAGRGARVVSDSELCDCERGNSRKECEPDRAGKLKYCSGEPGLPGHVVDEIWTYPEINGALVVLNWNTVEPAMDRYDWSQLDHELTAAAIHGKSLSLAIRAGAEGTPDWLFGVGGVRPVDTKDTNDSDPGERNCGKEARMGSPSDERYRAHWNGMLADLAAHVRTNAAWWQSLHQIKVGGLNNVSEEAKLPHGCLDDRPKDGVLDTIRGDACVCNTQRWAQAGYTPDELYEFYAVEEKAITAAFGSTFTMAFPLIQGGFPRVEGPTEFHGAHLRDQSGRPIQPGGTKSSKKEGTAKYEQTEQVIRQGLDRWGDHFMVFHNGLGPFPVEDGAPSNCSYGARVLPPSGSTPARAAFPIPPRGPVDNEPKCPNPWATNPGVAEHHLTGFQTNNEGNGVRTPGDVESALWNLTVNTNAVVLEIYAAKAWLVHHTIGSDRPMNPARASLPPPSPPYSKSIEQWNDELVERRRDFPAFPFPTEWSHTFTAVGTFGYYNPVTCGRGSGRSGTVVVSR